MSSLGGIVSIPTPLFLLAASRIRSSREPRGPPRVYIRGCLFFALTRLFGWRVRPKAAVDCSRRVRGPAPFCGGVRHARSHGTRARARHANGVLFIAPAASVCYGGPIPRPARERAWFRTSELAARCSRPARVCARRSSVGARFGEGGMCGAYGGALARIRMLQWLVWHAHFFFSLSFSYLDVKLGRRRS